MQDIRKNLFITCLGSNKGTPETIPMMLKSIACLNALKTLYKRKYLFSFDYRKEIIFKVESLIQNESSD